MSDQTKTLTKATETASTENSKTQNTGGKFHPEEINNIYIVYNTMKFKATQPEPTQTKQAQKVNFINCDLDDFFNEEKTQNKQTKQTDILCIVCKEDAIFKYKNNISLYGYCEECYKNHKLELYEQFKYDLMTEDYSYIKPYLLNDRIKKIKNEYRKEFINMLIINDERDKLQKFLNEDKIFKDFQKEIKDTFEEIKKEIKKPLKMDLTQDKKIYKFYLPKKYINDTDKIKKSFIEFIDDDLFLQIMDDDKLKKLIEDKNIRNYALYSDDIRKKLILYMNWIFYFMSDYDIEIFLRKNCKYNKHELLYKFKDYIDELDYTKAIKMINLNKFFTNIYNKNYIITPEDMEKEEDEEEEFKNKEDEPEDIQEHQDDKIYRLKMEDSKQIYYTELKKEINRLNYYKDNYKNYLKSFKETKPKSNLKRAINEYIKGCKKDDEVYELYDLVFYLYNQLSINIFQDKYKISINPDRLNILIEDIENDKEYIIYYLSTKTDEEIILYKHLEETIYYYTNQFKLRHLKQVYKNKFIICNKGDEMDNTLNIEDIIYNEYDKDNDLFININLKNAIKDALNTDGFNHIITPDSQYINLSGRHYIYIEEH